MKYISIGASLMFSISVCAVHAEVRATPEQQALLVDFVRSASAVKQCGFVLNSPVVYAAAQRAHVDVNDLSEGGRFDDYIDVAKKTIVLEYAISKKMGETQADRCARWLFDYGQNAPSADHRDWIR